MLESVSAMELTENKTKTILIAPSWQKDNILELCIDEILEQLIEKEYRVIVRPHPEFVKRFKEKMDAIIGRYENRLNDKFIIETDFSSNKTVFSADLLVTDWSTISQEFSYTTKKPSLFINTPMKIMNPEYKRIPLEPLEISLRDKIGVSVDVDKLGGLYEAVRDIFLRRDEFGEKIERVMEQYVYNIGRSEEVGGEYILSALEEKKRKRLERDGE